MSDADQSVLCRLKLFIRDCDCGHPVPRRWIVGEEERGGRDIVSWGSRGSDRLQGVGSGEKRDQRWE